MARWWLGKEKGQKSLPPEIEFPAYAPNAKANIPGIRTSLELKKGKEGLAVRIPFSLGSSLLDTPAFVIKVR